MTRTSAVLVARYLHRMKIEDWGIVIVIIPRATCRKDTFSLPDPGVLVTRTLLRGRGGGPTVR